MVAHRLPDWFKATPVDSRLTGRQLRVLLAVGVLKRRDGVATVRGVMELCNMKSPSEAHQVLNVLRARGFVTWHPEKSGTIVPLVEAALARRGR